jgi:hypothetical protein
MNFKIILNLSQLLIIKASELDEDTCDWHEVIVVNDIKVVDDGVPDIDKHIAHSLSIVAITRLSARKSFENLLVCVLVLTNN